MPAPPSKTFSPPDFTIDPAQANIILSKIKVTLEENGGGVLAWTFSANQYNRTHATGSPNNATVYVDLMNAAGGVIPGGRIVFHPSHLGCRGGSVQVWSGQEPDYPDALATISDVRLACQAITYDVDPC